MEGFFIRSKVSGSGREEDGGGGANATSKQPRRCAAIRRSGEGKGRPWERRPTAPTTTAREKRGVQCRAPCDWVG